MITAAAESLKDAGVDERLDVVLADGGYGNSPQITHLRRRGMSPIVSTKAATRIKPRALSARQGPEAERIDRLLDTVEGAALYRRRQQIIEPVFADTRFLRRIDWFQPRGLAACRAEWQFIAAGHNLLKLWRATRPALKACGPPRAVRAHLDPSASTSTTTNPAFRGVCATASSAGPRTSG